MIKSENHLLEQLYDQKELKIMNFSKNINGFSPEEVNSMKMIC